MAVCEQEQRHFADDRDSLDHEVNVQWYMDNFDEPLALWVYLSHCPLTWLHEAKRQGQRQRTLSASSTLDWSMA